MAADGLYCKFHQFGHCKFGQSCKKFHTQQTCTTFQCKVETCTSRHPKICKFFAQFGRCKFGDQCSYLHFSASENLSNAFTQEIDSLKADIDVLNCEIKELKSRTLIIESSTSKLDKVEIELKALRAVLDSDRTRSE